MHTIAHCLMHLGQTKLQCFKRHKKQVATQEKEIALINRAKPQIVNNLPDHTVKHVAVKQKGLFSHLSSNPLISFPYLFLLIIVDDCYFILISLLFEICASF